MSLLLRTMERKPLKSMVPKGAANCKRKKCVLLTALVLMSLLSCQAAFAIVEFCNVYVGQEKLFSVTNTQMLSALERGEQINERIKAIVGDPSLNPDSMSIRTESSGNRYPNRIIITSQLFNNIFPTHHSTAIALALPDIGEK